MEMSLKSKRTTIDGMQMVITQLPPRRAFKLGAKLLRHILPLMAAGKIDIKDPGADMAAILMLAQRLTEDEMEHVLGELLASVSVIEPGGRKGSPTKRVDLDEDPNLIDIVFAGRFETMLHAAKESLGVNFELFSKGGSKPAAISAVETPTESD